VFNVIQGHCFRCQSKAHVQLPIIDWPYLAPFLRHGDLLAKFANFSYLLSLSALMRVTSFKFMKKLYGSRN